MKEDKKIKRPNPSILGSGLAYQAGESLKNYRERLNESAGIKESIPDNEPPSIVEFEKKKKKDEINGD